MMTLRFAKCAVAVGAIGLASVLPSNAQAADGTATAAATIAAAIGIAKTADMNFGIMSPTASAGTVVLDTAGARTAPGGNVTLIGGGTIAAAAFDVTGGAAATYTITLPGADVTLTSGGDTMTIAFATFNDSLGGAGTLDGTGNESFTVGATLSVAAAQPAGNYLSAGFTVTVNYN